MRTNGYLKYLLTDGQETENDGLNEDGEPIDVEVQWSDPVPCFIQTVTHDERGKYVDGHFTQASYIVLTERGKIERAGRVQLTRGNEYLGEFAVQDQQDVCLDRIRIQV